MDAWTRHGLNGTKSFTSEIDLPEFKKYTHIYYTYDDKKKQRAEQKARE